MRKFGENMKDKIKEILIYVIIIVIVILVRTFIVTPIRVNGTSMYPTLDDKDFMILKKYEKKDLNRFDIVVIKTEKDKIIKRIIGMPKEDIEYKNNSLYIDGEKLDIPYGKGYTNDFIDYCREDEYFVLGDNREDSIDSRILGCIKREDIMGKTDFIVFPFKKWGKVE